MKIENLPGYAEPLVPVGHVSAEGEPVAVTREGDELKVASLNEPGAYTGTVDLRLDQGGAIDLTVDARDPWAGLFCFWHWDFSLRWGWNFSFAACDRNGCSRGA